MASSYNVGLVGFGNIGTGVVRALATNRELMDTRVPHPIRIVRIADRNTQTPRNAPFDPAILTANADDLLIDPGIQAIIELTGTMDFARDLVARALAAGKHVVTANKALMAVHGAELLRIAVEHGTCLLFEAAVGGGIPIIRTLHQGLAGNDITAIRGIINGTANYILSCMDDDGRDFQTALQQAQALGYAEPDPTLDIEGVDTAHKLVILASLAFGQRIRLEDVWVEGIRRIHPLDIAYCRELGYVIKLLGIARRLPEGSIEVRVHPTLLPEPRELASVNGVLNAIRVDGNLTGPIVLSGRGAGPEPTASAILSDLRALSSAQAEGGLGREMRLCVPWQATRTRPIARLKSRYYLRFGLQDVPGALAQVLTLLGRHGVSVASMEQPAEHSGEYAHVLILTHETIEANVQAALAEVRALPVNRDEPFLLRMEDMD